MKRGLMMDIEGIKTIGAVIGWTDNIVWIDYGSLDPETITEDAYTTLEDAVFTIGTEVNSVRIYFSNNKHKNYALMEVKQACQLG